MIEAVTLALACLAGGLLGVAFFSGLWWTVRKGVVSDRPVQWFLCSLLLRMSLFLGSLYLIGAGHWQRLMACLVGFSIARLIMTRLTRTSGGGQMQRAEVRHAP